ncbi:hypothetical protein TNCV_4140951 [Trichonephila clavipes]|nr:hypothetical protein TNCV_4140951 [Trichonephila clavipes]
MFLHHTPSHLDVRRPWPSWRVIDLRRVIFIDGSLKLNADDRYCEDLIVTPFAQILASLKTVRINYVSLTEASDR